MFVEINLQKMGRFLQLTRRNPLKEREEEALLIESANTVCVCDCDIINKSRGLLPSITPLCLL